MVFYFTDFRGGYAVDLPPERMEATMLKTAQNVYWRDGLQKRGGVSTYATTDISSYVSIRGMTRQYINNTWYTIAALENASGDVTFHYGLNNCGTLTAIDATYKWSSGYDVEFDTLDNKVVAVNGSNKPAIIYYSSGWVIKNLEANDPRVREDDDWWAGQYDASGPVYTDDTTDAQSTTGSADFQYVGTSGTGCYVAGTFTFNKIIFKNAEALGVTSDATYQYYKGSSVWGTMDLATTPSWVTGDVTLEWNYPSDWETWDGTEETMAGRYVARLYFTTPPAAVKYCTNLEISHTQYLTQIMADERPATVCTHLNRLYLGVGNNVNFSPPYRLTDWNEYDVEVFEQGGHEIKAMRSMGENLAVLKEGAIYGYFGNVWENREVRLLSTVGTIRGRTAQVVNNILFFLAKDGFRYFYGTDSKLISKHINTDVLGYTATNANAVNYRGEYLCVFPSNSIGLWFDPDTLRNDDRGDGRVSFYKFTGMTFDVMNWHSGGSDDGYLLGAQNISSRLIKRLQNGNYYDGTSTDIAVVVQTKDYSNDEPLRKKRYTRTKIDVTQSGVYQYRIYDEYSANYVELTVDAGFGSTHFHYDIAIPYTIDGNTFSQYLSQTGSGDVVVYGFAIDAIGRKY